MFELRLSGDVDEALVVAEVEVGLTAVVGDEDLAVLAGVHRPGVDVDVRVELAHRHAEPAGLQEATEGGGGEALAEGAGDPSGDEDELAHRPRAPLDPHGDTLDDRCHATADSPSSRAVAWASATGSAGSPASMRAISATRSVPDTLRSSAGPSLAADLVTTRWWVAAAAMVARCVTTMTWWSAASSARHVASDLAVAAADARVHLVEHDAGDLGARRQRERQHHAAQLAAARGVGERRGLEGARAREQERDVLARVTLHVDLEASVGQGEGSEAERHGLGERDRRPLALGPDATLGATERRLEAREVLLEALRAHLVAAERLELLAERHAAREDVVEPVAVLADEGLEPRDPLVERRQALGVLLEVLELASQLSARARAPRRAGRRAWTVAASRARGRSARALASSPAALGSSPSASRAAAAPSEGGLRLEDRRDRGRLLQASLDLDGVRRARPRRSRRSRGRRARGAGRGPRRSRPGARAPRAGRVAALEARAPLRRRCRPSGRGAPSPRQFVRSTWCSCWPCSSQRGSARSVRAWAEDSAPSTSARSRPDAERSRASTSSSCSVANTASTRLGRVGSRTGMPRSAPPEHEVQRLDEQRLADARSPP